MKTTSSISIGKIMGDEGIKALKTRRCYLLKTYKL
jgi:hypothetical protein